MSAYRFHAAPPPGEWLNDPNALVRVDNRYRLYAQHSVDGPNGDDVGWGWFESDDLLSWRWQGMAIAPQAGRSAYSGSAVAAGGGLEFFFTRHDPAARHQTQHRLDSTGETGALGPAGRNCRDPFVFHCAQTGDWRMLVAEPCDWTTWRDDRPSRLVVWRSPDRQHWEPAGQIGPWSPAGVMWEVPVLCDFGDTQALILSLVDRRADRADCSVRYWLGRFTGTDFLPDDRFPADGLLLDYGPDFYAAIINTTGDWPGPPVLIAWASHWEGVRQRRWADGVRGGPLTMPRRLSLDARALRLRQQPLPAALPLAAQHGAFTNELALPGLRLAADRARSLIRVNEAAPQPLARHDPRSTFTLFRDQDLLELFIEPEGVTVTIGA